MQSYYVTFYYIQGVLTICGRGIPSLFVEICEYFSKSGCTERLLLYSKVIFNYTRCYTNAWHTNLPFSIQLFIYFATFLILVFKLGSFDRVPDQSMQWKLFPKFPIRHHVWLYKEEWFRQYHARNKYLIRLFLKFWPFRDPLVLVPYRFNQQLENRFTYLCKMSFRGILEFLNQHLID